MGKYDKCRRLVAMGSEYDVSEVQSLPCVFCNFPYTIRHHIVYPKRKRKPIPVCPNCHFLLHFTNKLDARYQEMFKMPPPYKKSLELRPEIEKEREKERELRSKRKPLGEKLPEICRKYNEERAGIAEKHKLERFYFDFWEGGHEETYWVGSSLPIILDASGSPIAFRLYRAHERYFGFGPSEYSYHGIAFKLPEPHTWKNPVLRELWDCYAEYRKAKGALPTDRTGQMLASLGG